MPVSFEEALSGTLRRIPRGRVATCATIARALGDVRAAKAVAEWIREHPEVPASLRVVRADGTPIVRSPARAPQAHARLRLRGQFVDALPPTGFLARLRAEQERLAERVSEADEPGEIRIVTGIDAGYEGERARIAAVNWDLRSREAIEIVEATIDVDFPYIPTYLAYRELAAIRAGISRLRTRPDIVLIDGHGRLHPALFGVACHAGVKLDLRTIGVAKHPLVGKPEPSKRSEDAVPVAYGGRTRGFAWAPPGRSTPLFVSVGHRVSLATALRIVRDVTERSIPEPLRIADALTKKRKEVKRLERGSGR